MIQFQSQGINFIGHIQFWSNPGLAGTRESIPVVLSYPTLLDLIELSEKFGVDELIHQNNELAIAGSISLWRFQDNHARLLAIKKGLSDEALTA